MDPQLLERALEESGNIAYDLDSAIRSLNGLCLEGNIATTSPETANGVVICMDNLPSNGSEWVELLVREMMAASDVDDAKVRASRVLDVLAKSLLANAHAAAAATSSSSSSEKENILLKEENNVLKRAVAIQHKRQKEHEEELPRLKQLVAQYQEQLSRLEVSNYALAMHLKQAQQQSHSIAGRLHPDVF